MDRITYNLRFPAIISTILMLPFVILELVNRRTYLEDFPFPLFVLLWLLPLAFMIIITPIVQDLRRHGRIEAPPISLLLKSAALILIAWLWVGVLLDQMPCFLGVPLCD